MRVLIKLKSNTTQSYQNNYFHKFQGFVYNLLKGTEHEILHDKKGYKFFCFSNIFPLHEKNRTNVISHEFKGFSVLRDIDKDKIEEVRKYGIDAVREDIESKGLKSLRTFFNPSPHIKNKKQYPVIPR